MCSRPAVSTMSVSNPRFRATPSAPVARLTGSRSPSGSCTRVSICLPSTDSCWIAAGRRTSVDTIIGCRPCLASQRASFADVVVLPEPCRPSISTTRGVGALGDNPPCVSPNSASISSRTMRTTCCAGVRLRRTSSPTAFTRTRSMNALTTRKLTSASSSASLISRSAASTVASVSRASPRSDLKTSCSRVLSDSNMKVDAAARRARLPALTGVSANGYRSMALEFRPEKPGYLDRVSKRSSRLASRPSPPRNMSLVARRYGPGIHPSRSTSPNTPSAARNASVLQPSVKWSTRPIAAATTATRRRLICVSSHRVQRMPQLVLFRLQIPPRELARRHDLERQRFHH